MKIANFNGCQVYSLTQTRSKPEWLSEAKKRALSKDEEYRRRLDLIQDFEMTTAAQCIKMTKDGEHIIVTGGYPPLVRCYTVSDLALKFQRGLTCDIIAFESLSDDYGKQVFLQSDRTLSFHAPYGEHYKVRVPKFGRDMVYNWENCDLYVASSGEEVFRLNLESGRFKEPLNLSFEGCNKIETNPMHRLLGCGGEAGVVEFWDLRSKKSVAKHKVDPASTAAVTALKWDTDGLTLGLGTGDGNCFLYDIRSNKPVYQKEHQYGLPIIDVCFHNSSGSVISTDKKVVKIWDRNEDNMGKIMTNIETPADINGVHVVADQRGQSGMIMVAGEQSRVMTYFVPQLGPAPRWCSFLEGLTEELEESTNNSVYEDYKFVTKLELEELGATALVGTPMLKGYMHGYFMEMKLYSKLRAVSKPFEYEEHRKKKIRDKIEEKRQSRIIAQKRLPKVNKELAQKMMKGANRTKETAEVVDARFASLFKREEFEVDKDTEDYRLRNPTLASKRPGGEVDSEDDLRGMFTAVDEEEDDENDDDSLGSYDDEKDESGREEEDSDLEIYNPDDRDFMEKRDAKRAAKVKATSKNVAKEIKKQKKSKYDEEEEEGDIFTASKKAAEKIEKKLKKRTEFYELSDQFSSSKSAGATAVMLNDDAAKAMRKKEKRQGSIPLSERVSEQKKLGKMEQRVFKGTSGFTRELSYMPAADKKDKGKDSKRRVKV